MSDVDERIQQGAVLAKVIVEVLGKPREHVEKALKFVLGKLKEESILEVIRGKVFSAKPSGEELFSAFAELEILFNSVGELVDFCFEYMPSSVEVVSPEEFNNISAGTLSGWVNDLIATLHTVDMALKQAALKNQQLEANATNMLKNLIKISLKGKGKTMTELSTDCGIPEEQLPSFLERFIKEGMLKKEDSNYCLR